jgi:hypothetical protein
MSRGVFLAALGASLLAGCASDGPSARGGRLDLGGPRERLEFRANPSAVIAAELAFARLAQEKGQWTAFLETSTDDAVMFVPQAVNAHQWLRQQTNPAQAVKWQPHQVWSSCDGTLAVTKGAWQRPNGTTGYFTTVWTRERDGDYKWVLDQGDVLEQPSAAPELIDGKVAECVRPDQDERERERYRYRPAMIRAMACEGTTCRGGGTSADGTLSYDYQATAQGRQLTIQMRENGAMSEAMRSEVAAQ